MIDERELREMLHRRVRTISATPTDASKAVRRARRRLVLNGAVGVLVGLAVLAGAFAGFRTIQAAPTPADHPTPSVTPPPSGGVQRRDGETLVYNGAGASDDPVYSHGEVVAADPGTGETRVLVDAEELGGSLDSAAWSANGRWLAFETLRGCHWDPLNAGIWVTDGTGPARQVTSRPCRGPNDLGGGELWAWSPTSARLVVAHDLGRERPSLVVYDATTGGRTDLVWPSGVNLLTGLTWSPDGTKVVYSVSDSIYAMNVDDGSTSLLADSVGVINRDYPDHPPGASPYGSLSWSPDGSHLLFAAAPTTGTLNGSLYVMNPDGSALRKLVETYTLQAGFAWSPDGTTVAYATYGEEPGRRPFQIWTVSLEDPTPVLVYESPDHVYESPASSDTFAGSPVWSPDGTSIAYRIGFNDAWGATYFVVNADGSGDERPTDAAVYNSWRGGWYHCECYG
jgi:Tol biopolymer transport system component